MKRLRNTTTIPDWLVREVEQFVMPPGGVRAYDMELRNSKGSYGGRAYTEGSGYHDTGRPFIALRVARMISTRGGWHRRGGYLTAPALGSRVEALVYLMAHELRHLWQKRVPRGRRVWGARGQFSERDADAYALACLRRWRREALTSWSRAA